jgi:hypothetical protein
MVTNLYPLILSANNYCLFLCCICFYSIGTKMLQLLPNKRQQINVFTPPIQFFFHHSISIPGSRSCLYFDDSRATRDDIFFHRKKNRASFGSILVANCCDGCVDNFGRKKISFPHTLETWGQCYDHNFLRFSTIFDEKIGVFLKNQCYDQNFA